MELIIVLAGLLSYVIVGLCILDILRIDIGNLEKLALSFGIGGGVVSLELMLFSLSKIPISFISALLPWFIIFFYLLWKKQVFKKTGVLRSEFTPVDYTLTALIALIILLCTSYVLLSPVSSWDAIASWSMLAKGFFYEQSLTGEFYKFFNFENPPLLSLQQSFLSTLNGEYNDQHVMLLYTGYFVSLLLLFYSLVKRNSTTTNALIFTFFLASLPLIVGQAGRYDVGYVDLPLSYFIFASFFALNYLFVSQRTEVVFLLGLLSGFTALTKNEGMGISFVISLIAIFILFKKKKARRIVFLMMGFILLLGWRIYSYSEGIQPHYLYGGALDISRIPSIIEKAFLEMMNIKNWNFLWISFLLSLTLLSRSKIIITVLAIIFVQLFIYFGIYLITPVEFPSHIDASLSRFFLHLSPLVVFVVAYAFANPSLYHEKK